MKTISRLIWCFGLALLMGACENFSSCKDGKSVDWSVNLTNSSPDLMQVFSERSDRNPDGGEDYSYTAIWGFNNLCPDGLIFLDIQVAITPFTLIDWAEIILLSDKNERIRMNALTNYGQNKVIYECFYADRLPKNTSTKGMAIIVRIYADGSASGGEELMRQVFESCKIDLSYVTAN